MYVINFDPTRIFINWAHQNDRQNLSFVKKWPGMVVQRTCIKEHSFVYRLYECLIMFYRAKQIVYAVPSFKAK